MSQDGFLESLKTYLHRLTEVPALKRDTETPAIDPSWARRLLIRVLNRVEGGESSTKAAAQAIALLDEWQTGDRITVFVRELARLLRQGVAADATMEGQLALIEVGLARWFGLPGQLQTRIVERELDRLVKEAQKLAWQASSVFVGLDIVRYSVSNQLTVQKDGRVRVSPIGDVFQQLQGRDAVRWLLQVEAQLAVGQFDPERLSKEAASAILTKGTWGSIDMAGYSRFPCHELTASRLQRMGLLLIEIEAIPLETISHWSISPLGSELLAELVLPSKTPLALLAESLCSDLMSRALQAVGGSQAILGASAAEATASTARMVAHEARNALLPVQAALDSLYREILVLPPSEVLSRRRPVIDGGIKGALRFTKDLLHTAELGAKPPERFEPVQAAGEVVAELVGTSQVVLSAPTTSTLPLLLGRRANFVLAVRTMIENAIQHGGANLRRVSVSMSLDERGEAVLLDIDDDGQGVPEVDRERIFHEGVTNKPGGTGLGLSWVKLVVEGELHGVVVCTPSPLGGARFASRLPIAVVSPPPSAKEQRR